MSRPDSPQQRPASASASPAASFPAAAPPPELAYPPAAPDALLPPALAPFFAVVEDATTGEHLHPRVHYVFADDEPDTVTQAALRALSGAAEPGAPPPDRTLLVTVGPTSAPALAVTAAHSLDADWAVTRAALRRAPSFSAPEGERGAAAADGSTSDAEAAPMMLWIEGARGADEASAPVDQRWAAAQAQAGGDVFGALDGLGRRVGRADVGPE